MVLSEVSAADLGINLQPENKPAQIATYLQSDLSSDLGQTQTDDGILGFVKKNWMMLLGVGVAGIGVWWFMRSRRGTRQVAAIPTYRMAALPEHKPRKKRKARKSGKRRAKKAAK